jgi:hypothetical protein
VWSLCQNRRNVLVSSSLRACLAVTITSTSTVVGIACERVVKAVKELGAKQNIAPSLALEKYCGIPSIEVEDEQFCYNVATLKKDVNRLLDLGADASRVCKKVRAVNSDFCKSKVVKVERTGIQLNERFKKGTIYE